MRVAFKAANGIRTTFAATVARFATKPAFRGPAIPTVLLQNVTDRSGTIVTDHLWFTITKRFEDAGIQIGDRVQFDARVRRYRKGYRGHRDDDDLPVVSIDYRLSHATNIRIIRRDGERYDTTQQPLFL